MDDLQSYESWSNQRENSDLFTSFISARTSISDTGSMFTCIDDADKLEAFNDDSSPFEIYWRDLVYKAESRVPFVDHCHNLAGRGDKLLERSIFPPKRCIKILPNINGSIKSGQLTAVMGPSGAGKSTLLSFLAKRRHIGYSGILDTTSVSQRKLAVCTIPQEDHLTSCLTVRESLTFASKFKNPDMTREEHENNVEQIALSLGLDKCLEQRNKSLSGGQSKRVSVGQELVSRPDVLILDEPTSGLDSLTCYRVIQVLNNLTKMSKNSFIKPMAIVVTIHQPQREVFDLFDKIYTMSNGGRVIYNGPPDACISYLKAYSGLDMNDEYPNPATYMIEIASGEFGEDPINRLADTVRQDFSEHLDAVMSADANSTGSQNSSKKSTHLCDDNMPGSNSNNAPKRMLFRPDRATRYETYGQLKINSRIVSGSAQARIRFWYQFSLIIHRHLIQSWRDPYELMARFLFYVVLGITIKFLFGPGPVIASACPYHEKEINLALSVGSKDDSRIENQNEDMVRSAEWLAFVFCYIFSSIILSIATTNLSFTLAVQGVHKETCNGWYSMNTYLLGKTLADLPSEIILPMIGILIIGPLPSNIDNYYQRMAIIASAISLATMAGQSIGLITSILYVGDLSSAMITSQGIIMILSLLSGFLVRVKNMSPILAFLSNGSILRTSMEIMMIGRYGFGVCGKCDPNDYNSTELKITGVPEQIKNFAKYWLLTSELDQDDTDLEAIATTTITDQNLNSSADTEDLFQMFGRQIALGYSYGMDLRSCEDVRPFQMYMSNIDDSDLQKYYIILTGTILLSRLIVWALVKFCLNRKLAI